jgi:hypothetical protein
MSRTRAPRVLNHGIDSWDIRASRNLEPSQWLREHAALWRKSREEFYADSDTWEPMLEVIPGVGTFQVLPSTKHYEFVLINPEVCDIRIWNPDHWLSAVAPKVEVGADHATDGTGQFYISTRSKFIQFNGPQAVLEVIEKVVAFLTGEPMMPKASRPLRAEYTRTSRFDVFADVDTVKPLGMKDVNDHFTCRARKRDYFFEAHNDSLEREFIKSGSETATARGVPLLNNKGVDRDVAKLRKRCLRDRKFAILIHEMTLDVLGNDPDGGLSRVIASGGRDLQTAYFGRFGSPLYARVYDKLASLPVQKKEYMRDVWRAEGWDDQSPVWRFEFSMSGDFLRAAQTVMDGVPDLRDVNVTLAAVPGLWAYLTQTWLKHCKPSRDKNVNRWEESTLWKTVQGAFTAMTPIVRITPAPRPDLAQLTQQAKGVVLSIAAKMSSVSYRRSVPSVDLETGEVFDPKTEIIKEFFEYLHSEEGCQKLEDRILRFGLDEMSDTVFSATLRSQQLLEGRGS